MSGKRLVSSVQITLAPPWRAEVSRRTQSRTLHEEYGRPARQTPSQPAPRAEQPETEHGDFQNGGTSFHHSFLDEVHTTEDFFSSDLPPPLPSPPVSRKTFTRQEPLPGPPAPVSGKTQKQIHRDPPPPALDSFPDFPPPVSLKVQKKIPRDPLPKHPAPASLSLDLRKLDLSEPTSGQKPSSVIPTEVNPSRHENASYVQQKREHPTSEKPGHNGHSAKLDNGGSDICAFCHKTILPSAATIEAMKKQYHASCFTCRKCHRLLAGQQYYQKDGQPICDHCYKETLEKCAKCQTLITHHIVRAMGNGYHPECFTCVICNRMIADESFAVDEYNDVHCAEDYYRKYAPICSVCDEPIIPREDDEDSYKIECLGRNFHENCYRCEKCHIALSLEPTDSGCYPLQGHILCKPCHLAWTDQS